MRRFQRLTALTALVALAGQLSCGTIIYPERRGQKGGRIDPAVVIMDGIGCLLFLIPGLVAFAVDFGTGAIYLPGRRRGEVERVPFQGHDLAAAAAVVEQRLGVDLDARLREARVIQLEDATAARARIAALGGEAAPEQVAAH